MANGMNDVRPARLSIRSIRGHGLLRAAFFFSLFTNLLMLTGPLFMLQVYDRVLGSRSEETLVALFMLVAFLYALYALLDYARGRLVARVGARFQTEIGPDIFAAILQVRATRSGRDSHEAQLQDVEAIRGFFTSPVLLALFDLPWTPVFLLAILIFHPLLGWLALAGGATLIVAAIANQIITGGRVGRAQRLAREANDFARAAQEASPFIWAQGMGDAMRMRWAGMDQQAIGRAISAHDWTGSFAAFTRAFRLLIQSAMLALGAWLTLQSEMTAGAMIAATILLGRALAPIEQGLPQWPVVQRARASWHRLARLLASVPATDVRARLPDPAAALNARNLTLIEPRGDRALLGGVSFYVGPGEALGIIGKSGSGKSTLARALLGLAQPSGGEVRLSGATIPQYGPERVGELIGYLPQEIQFFDGTVAENIARMQLDPDFGHVVVAARKAHVHEVILRLPDGYDTRIGPSTLALSGGQKQRLALARALYGDPLVLVLDEPSSALDADGSEALNRAVAGMKQAGKSVVIMTHRPAAIAQCDQLMVLDAGRVASYGPREEVMQTMLKNASYIRRAVTKEAS